MIFVYGAIADSHGRDRNFFPRTPWIIFAKFLEHC